MQVNGPFHGTGRSGAKPLSALARMAVKPNVSGQFGTDRQDSPNTQQQKQPRLQVELVCQDGTKAFDPFWDGPRLKPVFVAQLLGQVMPARDATITVADAYGKAPARMALLVDHKS